MEQVSFRAILGLIVGVMALLIVLGLVEESRKRKGPEFDPPLEPSPIPTLTPYPETPATERVWEWYADEIALLFGPEARQHAQRLYDADDAHNLDRFCREEIARATNEHP